MASYPSGDCMDVVLARSEAVREFLRSKPPVEIRRRSVALVPVDGDFRMDVKALERVLDRDACDEIIPVAIVANAGTVNTGAVDPIPEIARIAVERRIWLHVYGAYGICGKLDPRVASRFDGLERAESLVCDPHKWLAAPPGSGAVFVRERALLERAFTMEPADYAEGSIVQGKISSTFDSPGENFLQLGPEMSAQSRGVAVWAILKEIGAEGVRERIIRHNDHARLVYRLAMEDARLEALHEPILSICCFRYQARGLSDEELDTLNMEIAQRLRVEGIVPSTTRVRGRYAIRPCFINPRTGDGDVRRMVARVREIGDALTCMSTS